MTTQQHTSHQPPSGQGHATQPVLIPAGLRMELVELPSPSGRFILIGVILMMDAIGKSGFIREVRGGL